MILGQYSKFSHDAQIVKLTYNANLLIESLEHLLLADYCDS